MARCPVCRIVLERAAATPCGVAGCPNPTGWRYADDACSYVGSSAAIAAGEW